MRKLIAVLHITLDGVIQGCGGATEDTEGGFALGGWIGPYADEVGFGVIRAQMDMPFDLLLGRKTYDIWAPYWPKHGDFWPNVNTATKYVASNTFTSGDWQPSAFFGGDVAERVRQIKRTPGNDLHVYGSADLLQTLMAADLMDAYWLKIYPVTLGSGKRLFEDGAIPAAFKLTECTATTTGVIIANYERAGALITEDAAGERLTSAI